MSIASILENAPKLALELASERDDRQQRIEADPADYERLRQMGIPLLGVPVEFGGFGKICPSRPVPCVPC